jgi:uncharacterized membrane protein (DUF2068 family)
MRQLTASVLALVAIAVVSLYLANMPVKVGNDSDLDLNCGFTEDFSKFIKDNGKSIIII